MNERIMVPDIRDEEIFTRPGTVDDGPELQTLVFGCLREYGLAPDPEATDADLLDVERHYGDRGGRFDVLVQRRDGAVVGSVGLVPVGKGICELRKMYFSPAIRGRGYGKRLLEQCIEWCRRAGFVALTLETASSLTEAMALYEKYGFRREGCVGVPRCDRRYRLDLVDMGADSRRKAGEGERS